MHHGGAIHHAGRTLAVFALTALATAALAPAAGALRLVTYNILNYPGASGSARAVHFQTVLAPIDADVIVAEEIVGSTNAGPLQFLDEVLDVTEPGEWATVDFINGNDTDATLFYKPGKVEFLGQSAFYPNPADLLRLVHVYRIRPVGYTAPEAALHLYVAHLKASTGYENQRLAECAGIRDSMNVMPEGTHALVCGDLNFYTAAAEPGYAKLLEDQTDDTGRVYDMLPAGAWHDNQTFAIHHTQSPCLSGTCASGAATGGMDDRFDFLLPTINLGTGQGFSVIPGTCIPVGNDGLHLNKNITDSPVIPEGAAYATALKLASDHLPLRLDLQVPAMLSASSSLDFGRVIAGAAIQVRDLVIENPAFPPADSLDCAFSVPDGFMAPDPITVAAGSARPAQVSMLTDVIADRTGDMVVETDAPDDPAFPVRMTGIVLDHAIASLDSAAIVHDGALDFGDHEAGEFGERSVRVHNAFFDPLQAALAVHAGSILDGGGRFSFVGGFHECLVGAIGEDFHLTFEDAGAAPDSTYTATLVFSSADEPIPGSAAQPDLIVSLRARVTGGVAPADDLGLPAVARLLSPSPNPFADGTTIRLDLARDLRNAAIAIYDPAGRCLATVFRGDLRPGRHAFRWDGRGDSGVRLGAGVYFVRLNAVGSADRHSTRLAVRH